MEVIFTPPLSFHLVGLVYGLAPMNLLYLVLLPFVDEDFLIVLLNGLFFRTLHVKFRFHLAFRLSLD